MHCVETALDRTGPQHRESAHWTCDPLKLHWPEVPQLEEIAHTLGCPLGTVKSNLHKAVHSLKNLLLDQKEALSYE
jgi:hypothetical protein